MKQHTAELLLVLAVMIWGSTYVSLKDAEEGFAPFTILTLRFGIAFLFGAILLHRSLACIAKKTIAKGAVLGFLIFCVIGSQIFALPTTPTTTVGFLFATMVVIVPIIQGIVFRKIPGLPLVAGIGLAASGVVLLAFEQETLVIGPGSVLCLGGAFCLALQIIATGEFVKTEDPLSLGILQFGFAALFGLVPALLTEPVPAFSWSPATILVLYLAVICTFIAFLLQTVAQKYTTPEHTSLIFTLESVFAAVFGFFLLHEVFTLRDYIGIALILSGVLIVICKENRNRQETVACNKQPDNFGTGG